MILKWTILFNVVKCIFSLSTGEIATKQANISRAINDTFEVAPIPLVQKFKKSDYSDVLDVCNVPLQSSLLERTGCCTPSDVKHLFNVLVQDGKFVLFSENPKPPVKLPGVTSVKTQQKINLIVPVSYITEKYSTASQCKNYFDGTLHIVGRSTVKNVYHALGDNVLPLAAQMLLDAYLAPDFLHKPRMLLSDTKEEGVPHLSIMYKLMSGGMTTLKDLDGTCISRVVWGHGPHLNYLDTMIALRRKASEFIRIFSLQMYNIKLPAEFSKSPLEFTDKKSLIASNSRKELHPLRVAIYSRGNTGKGRSMKGEELLVAALRKMGALVVHLVDFGSMTLDQQLSVAIYSDVILGMHGAAITHGVFMAKGSISIELKTLYAFDSLLFGIMSDSRQGIHGQVDIRKYFVPGGHRPVDGLLVNRTINVIEKALQYQLVLFPEYHKFLKEPASTVRISNTSTVYTDEIISVPSEWPNDIIYGPSSYPPSTEHILGPLQSNQTQICHSLLFAKVRVKLGGKAESFHCDICKTYVVRRL